MKNRAFFKTLALMLVFALCLSAIPAAAFAVTQEEVNAMRAERDAIAAKRQEKQAVVDQLEAEQAGVMERKRAMDERNAYTLQQIRLFTEGAGAIDRVLGYHPMWHVLNSAGIERFPQYQFDMVRLGIGIYGIDPVDYPAGQTVRRGLKPVASLKVKILQIKTLKQDGSTIGYGRHGIIAPEGTVIATIPAGYADGLDRHLGQGRATFLLNGRRIPTIGNICMDMSMLDVTGIPAQVGDTVTIFGEDPTVTEMASILDTIPYEILTRVPRRIKRVVIRK